MTTTDPRRCPDCGSELPTSGPDAGLCTRCLLRGALGDGSLAETGDPIGLKPGTRIGPYRLIEKIGEGGMGVVYRAEQKEPVRRTVAIKLIRSGLDTVQVVARFEAERQALALMDHPGIARIHDAGTTDEGRPYFVMEYVPGEPVTEYCDRRRLSTNERLALFLEVCDAVQHAHHRGVIHRDVKPTNVIVTEVDGEPTVRVIDFGVAKATRHKLTPRTLVTQLGLAIGTPEYMSPEQASGTGLDVDTRADVYSLGVLLYELLVGALPFDPAELRQVAFDEALRKIREDEPPRPSQRLCTLGDASRESAARRSTDVRSLDREIRGDLDWIVMKALDKDRNRRYDAPAELARDIGRHLADEPVTAGPPSAAYRARKFVRRHRIGVAVAATVASALVVGAALATWGLVRAVRSEERALVEAATSRQALEFMTRVFGATDPWNEQGRPLSARDLLEAGADRVADELASQPLVQATLMETMGKALQHQWANERAEKLFRDALAIRERLEGPDHPATIGLLVLLSNVLDRMGRLDEATTVAREAFERGRSALGEEHLRTVRAKQRLAICLEGQGRFEEALGLLQEALQVARRSLGERHQHTMSIQLNVGNMYVHLGRYEEAEPLMRATLSWRERELGTEHPATVTAAMYLAEALLGARRLDEARQLLEPAVEARLRLQGENHPMTLMTRFLLGRTYREMGRLDDAERILTDVLERRLAVLGPVHPETLPTYKALGLLYIRQGRPDRMEQFYERALDSLPADADRASGRLAHELETLREKVPPDR